VEVLGLLVTQELSDHVVLTVATIAFDLVNKVHVQPSLDKPIVRMPATHPAGGRAQGHRLGALPGTYQLMRIFAGLDSGFFSTVTPSTPSL
jgi:hypothetical protein